MASFDLAIPIILGHEGGLVNNPKDPGKLTNFGISKRFLSDVWQKQGKALDGIDNYIKNMKKADAMALYRIHFWRGNYNGIQSQKVANFIFDTAVTSGHAQAHKLCQRSLWAVDNRYYEHQKIEDDGFFGPNTLSAVNNIGEDLLPAFKASRASFFRLLATIDTDKEIFLNGWLNRCYSF